MLPTMTVQGWVLKVQDAGDTGKKAVLLTKEYGWLTVYAPGMKKTQKNIGLFTPTAKLRCTLGKDSQWWRWQQGEGLQFADRAWNWRYEEWLVYYGVVEYLLDLFPHETPEPQLYSLWSRYIDHLQRKNKEISSLILLWQMLAIAGYDPARELQGSFGRNLSAAAKETLVKILSYSWNAEQAVSFSEKGLQEAARAWERFTEEYVDIPGKIHWGDIDKVL